MGQLEPEAVGQGGVDLEGVPQAELPVLKARLLGEVLVEELAHSHGVRGLDGISRREVVVLARVDDDPGPRMHLTRKPLVHKGSDRVDVPKEDAVHRVVEHHVEPLEAGERRDLRHAETARVVGQADIAAEFLARLVEGSSHEPEVLLRGIGPGIALARRALGDEVEQALPGRTDDGDDVGTLARGLLGLRDVLVDVTSGDDEIDPGLLLRLAVLGNESVPCCSLPIDGPYAVAHRTARGSPRPGAGTLVGQPEVGRTARRLLGERQEIRRLAARQSVPDRGRDTVLQAHTPPHRIDEVVDPRHIVVVGAGETGHAERGSLDGHGGVGLGQVDHGLARGARQRAGPAHGRAVEVEQCGGGRHEGHATN